MAVQETYRPLLHEMFMKINNKKDRPGKIKILQQYDRIKSYNQFCVVIIGNTNNSLNFSTM